MRKLGALPRQIASYNTCQHKGRVFHFSQRAAKLRVTEVLLGDRVEFVEVQTDVRCKTSNDKVIGCCSLDGRILVMSGRKSDLFAALVNVDEGKLSAETIHVISLKVKGKISWAGVPFLCQVSEDRALLYLNPQRRMWYCDVKGCDINLRKLSTQMPAKGG